MNQETSQLGYFRNLKFERSDFQKKACHVLSRDNNGLFSGPTGSGKTIIAKDTIQKHLDETEDKLIVYTTPIKALSNQIYRDLCQDFGVELVSLITGDQTINPDTSRIYVMTTESYRNSMYRLNEENKNLILELYDWYFSPEKNAAVIHDEVHFINDFDRGKVWEDSIRKTILLSKIIEKPIQNIMLSATIEGSEKIIELFEKNDSKCEYVLETHRPVPLNFYMFTTKDIGGNHFHEFKQGDKWLNGKWDETLRYVKNYNVKINDLNVCIKQINENKMTPCTFFILSRARIDEWVEKIPYHMLDKDELHEVKKIWDTKMKPYEKEFRQSEYFHKIHSLVLKGIGIHHSGIIPLMKDMVQILYEKGLIKILLATETFAVGINGPTKCVVFERYEKRSNNTHRLLNPAEFTQMAGRAGRRGFDTVGLVVCMTSQQSPDEASAKRIMMGKPLKIQSKLRINPHYILELLHEHMFYKIETEPIEFLINQLSNTILGYEESNKLSTMKKELEGLKNSSSSEYIDPKIIESWEKINKLDSEILSCGNKKKKKLLKQKALLMNQFDKKSLIKIKEFGSKQTKYNNYKNIYDAAENCLRENIILITNYMIDQKLIDTNYQLSPWGLIVKEIHDCNPYVLSKIVIEGEFDDLSFPEIASTLSLFLKSRGETENIISELNISDNQKELIQKIKRMNYEFETKEIELNNVITYKFFNEWDVNTNMIEMVYQWCSGKNWSEVKELSSKKLFEGNFVKNMLSLKNIIKSVYLIAKLQNNTKLLDTLYQYETKIVKGIVVPETLYSEKLN